MHNNETIDRMIPHQTVGFSHLSVGSYVCRFTYPTQPNRTHLGTTEPADTREDTQTVNNLQIKQVHVVQKEHIRYAAMVAFIIKKIQSIQIRARGSIVSSPAGLGVQPRPQTHFGPRA